MKKQISPLKSLEMHQLYKTIFSTKELGFEYGSPVTSKLPNEYLVFNNWLPGRKNFIQNWNFCLTKLEISC